VKNAVMHRLFINKIHENVKIKTIISLESIL